MTLMHLKNHRRVPAPSTIAVALLAAAGIWASTAAHAQLATSEEFYGWTSDYSGDEPNTLLLWKFDSPDFGQDSSGNGNTANFASTGATTGVSGRFGGEAFRSEVTSGTSGSTANDSYAQGGIAARNVFDGSAMSVEFWFRPVSDTPGSATGWSYIFDKKYTDAGGISMRFNTDTGLRVDVHNGSALRILTTGALDWTADEWYHIATTYDASTGQLRIFRDGESVAQSTDGSYGSLANAESHTWRLGNRLGSSYGSVPGDYDNFRVSDVAYNYAIPEPGTSAMVAGIAALALLLVRRVRRRTE